MRSRRSPGSRTASLLLAGLVSVGTAACGAGAASKAEVLACVHLVEAANEAEEGLERDAAVEGLTEREKAAHATSEKWYDEHREELDLLLAEADAELGRERARHELGAPSSYSGDALDAVEALLAEHDAVVESECA